MVASEVAALGGIVIQIAQLIRDMGGNWYKASVDWADFPRKVNLLQRRHEFWQAQFTKFAMSSDTALMETLRDAKLLLDDEQDILWKRNAEKTGACGCGCWPKVSMTVFPVTIGLRIQAAIDAYDAIFEMLRSEEEGATLVENRALRRPSSLRIRKDDRYVPLKATETAIHDALENTSGLAAILLHGGPGKGKSTLGRHMAVHYSELSTNQQTMVFRQVVYLECGREVDILAKQLELLQLLRYGSTNPHSQQGQSGSDVPITKRLSDILKDQTILVILDDVWEEGFLQQMIDLCGAKVKCLVTSQRGNLCQGVNCLVKPIQIEDIQQEDARKILASYVGLLNQHIPTHLEGIMDRMIKETEGNPLALASIATAIDNDRSDELEEWEAASQEFLQLLRSEDTALNVWINQHLVKRVQGSTSTKVETLCMGEVLLKKNINGKTLMTSALIYGKKYPKSFWSAMRLSIQSLKEDAQNLLILTHLCDGPSVPEEVINVLYRGAKFQGESAPFSKLRKELESRALLKIITESLGVDGSQKQRSWTVHSLQRLFIEDEMGDRKKMVFSLLSGPKQTELEHEVEVDKVGAFPMDEHSMVQTSLCALYLDKQFAKEASSQIQVPFEKFNNLRRNAIQPITRLLGKPSGDKWKTTAQAFARQVFLRYICYSELHDDGIAHLLASPISTLPMLTALDDILVVEEITSLDANSQGLNKIVNSPEVLKEIVNLLSKDDDPSLQEKATELLGNLAEGEDAQLKIAHFPGASYKLVKLLSKNRDPGLQEKAVELFINLSGGEEAKLKAIQYDGALEKLVNLLSKDSDPSLQEKAIDLLSNLVEEEETKVKVIHVPLAIDKLVNLLGQESNINLQAKAARIIQMIGFTNMENIKQTLSRSKGLVEGLLGLLTNGMSMEAKGWAAGALTLIHPRKGNKMRLSSKHAYYQRGSANMFLGLNNEALVDLDKAHELDPTDLDTLRFRCTMRARVGDVEGALVDANYMIEAERTPLHLQERGVLKRMMGDLDGALADLNEGLDLEPGDYDRLKHRGFVKFLMKDEDGAHSDAKGALKNKSAHVDSCVYGCDSLGGSSVEFLGYKLK